MLTALSALRQPRRLADDPAAVLRRGAAVPAARRAAGSGSSSPCSPWAPPPLLFLFSDAPPLVFAVMPMFAWLAFRGTLREASLLLVGVSIVANTPDRVPARPRLGPPGPLRPPAASWPAAFLQLFLLDCAPDPAAALGDGHPAADVRRPRRLRSRDPRAADLLGHRHRDHRHRRARPDHASSTPARRRCSATRPRRSSAELPDGFFPDDELRPAGRAARALPIFADIAGRLRRDRGQRHRCGTSVASDGEYRTLRMTLTAVQEDERGELTGHLGIAEDVTEREDAHRALVTALDHERSAVDQLRELERVKARLRRHREPRAAHPDHQHGRLPELLEDGAVGELTPAQLGAPRAGRAQRPSAAAAGRGPADALRTSRPGG